MRPRLRLRGALLLGTLIPLLIVAVVALVVTQALTDTLDDTQAASRSQTILFTANLVAQDVIDAETGVRGFVITGQEPFLVPYTRGASAFSTDIRTLETLTIRDPDQSALVASVRLAFEEWDHTAATEVIDLVRAGSASLAVDFIASGAGKRLTDGIRVDLAVLTAVENDRAATLLASTRDVAISIRRLAFWGTTAAIVLAIAIAIVFARRLARRVAAVSAAAASFASGDAHEPVPVSGQDELADLGRAFNAMVTQLDASAAAERAALDDLRQRTVEVENANRELEAFSYSVSHDLRAPLRALDGFAQALTEDYGDQLDGTAANYLGRIRAASVRMATLIDDLLRLSRLTRDVMHEAPLDVSAIAADVIEELRAAHPGRVVQATVQLGMSAFGDRRLIRIALENLIGNAWKFTSEQSDARVEVAQEPAVEGGRFIVTDNGAGFDMRYAANLFAPFQRMHAVERFAGTGIGLATVQRIVHRHGGSITAESEVGVGTRFMFTLGESMSAPGADETPEGGEASGL